MISATMAINIANRLCLSVANQIAQGFSLASWAIGPAGTLKYAHNEQHDNYEASKGHNYCDSSVGNQRRFPVARHIHEDCPCQQNRSAQNESQGLHNKLL